MAVITKIILTGALLKATAAKLAGTQIGSAALKSIKLKIIQQVVNRLRERWGRNPESIAFDQLLEQLNTDLDRMADCLEAYSQEINKTADRFAQTQTTIKNKASALRPPSQR